MFPPIDFPRWLDEHRHFNGLRQNSGDIMLYIIYQEDGATRTGSVLIINVPDLAVANEFSANEPLRTAGVFSSVKISRMRRGQWHPAAAPKSDEGN